MIADHDQEGPKLLRWFNEILSTGSVPEDWAEVVMVVLAKIAQQEQAKHVRPISMGSAVNKLYARMFLERSKERLGATMF